MKWVSVLLLACAVGAQERERDVIYGRKHGLALTMDVFRPKKKRDGAAVVFVVSSGWWSAPRGIRPRVVDVYTERGYTVFAVVHGSMPKFTIPEAAADVHRGVRFIRANAKRFGIDKKRIAIMGGSAGGQLALLVATAGTAGKPGASDPVARESSRVQVVAALFPPTDFLNWEKPGQTILQTLAGERFRAPFDFRTYDLKTGSYVPLDDKAVQAELRAISPITHVSGDDPPAMLIHGDRDPLVPVQQSELMFAALERAGCRARLIVKEGAGHGWRRFRPELEMTADWFDRYLR